MLRGCGTAPLEDEITGIFRAMPLWCSDPIPARNERNSHRGRKERVIQDQSPDFLVALEQALVAAQHFPESTYRVQFHAGFTFRDALHIVPYLHDLGITHLYASPLLQARPGSTHGYDITNHQTFNPELGTAE